MQVISSVKVGMKYVKVSMQYVKVGMEYMKVRAKLKLVYESSCEIKVSMEFHVKLGWILKEILAKLKEILAIIHNSYPAREVSGFS